MAYTPSVQDRRGEIFAQGFSSLADLAETYKLKKEEASKTAGEFKAFGQTIEGLIKTGSLPASALNDYQKVVGADVKTQQGYLSGAIKSLNLLMEAGRDAQARAHSEAAIAVSNAQLAKMKQEVTDQDALTKSYNALPKSVSGSVKEYSTTVPTGNLNDFLYGGGTNVSGLPSKQSGMASSMVGDLNQAPTSQPRSFYSRGLEPISYNPETEESIRSAPIDQFTRVAQAAKRTAGTLGSAVLGLKPSLVMAANEANRAAENEVLAGAPYSLRAIEIRRQRGIPQPSEFNDSAIMRSMPPNEFYRFDDVLAPGAVFGGGLDPGIAPYQIKPSSESTQVPRQYVPARDGMPYMSAVASGNNTKRAADTFDSSFGKTVPVIPPNELKSLVYPDTEKKEFAVLNDYANRLRNDQKKMIDGTKNQISDFEDLLRKGRQDVSMQVLATGVAMPTPNTRRTSLTDTERAETLPRLTNAKAQLALQEQGLFALEKRITSAEKFAGTPLTQKAIDPAVDPVIKILSLPNVTRRNLNVLEVKTERPLTSDEKTSFVISDYVKRGGKFDVAKLAAIKDVTKSDLEVFEVNGVTVIKLGDKVQMFNNTRPTNAALLTVQTRENYQKSISLAARIGFNNLSDIDRATLSELHDEHGDKNTITGARFSLPEVVANRAKNIYPGRLESAKTFIDLNKAVVPVPNIGGRFDIIVKVPAK